jgi:L-ascorbate peroxidase
LLQLGNKGFGDPVTFDNAYFTALLQQPWNDRNNSMANMIGLPSDHVLPESEACVPAIRQYASSQAAFFEDFASAYSKLASLGTSLA